MLEVLVAHLSWSRAIALETLDSKRASAQQAGRDVVVELSAVGGNLRLEAVKDLFGQSSRIGCRLDRQRRHRSDEPKAPEASQLRGHSRLGGTCCWARPGRK